MSHGGAPSNIAKGPLRETTLDAPCAACGRTPVLVRSLALDLPHFGEPLRTTRLCEACGHRHTDPLPLRDLGRSRTTLAVSRPKHLSARVACSSSGTVWIPDLAASMEPGPRAEAFVGNVEGILRRSRDVVLGQRAVAESRAQRAELGRILRRLEGMIEGRAPFPVVLEDPVGNREILHPEAVRTALSAKEASKLKSSGVLADLGTSGRNPGPSPSSPA